MAASPTTEVPTEFRAEVIDKIAALATAAFGLVAALAWNSAIQAIFDRYFGAGSQITGLLIYAGVVTLIAVGVTIWIGRVAGRVRQRVATSRSLRSGGPGRPMS